MNYIRFLYPHATFYCVGVNYTRRVLNLGTDQQFHEHAVTMSASKSLSSTLNHEMKFRIRDR